MFSFSDETFITHYTINITQNVIFSVKMERCLSG